MYSRIGGSRRLRLFVVVLAVTVVALVVYAFSASNTVPGAKVGSGSSTISGYTISSVVYNLNASNPQNIDSVTLNTSALANTVKIQLVTAGSWYSCTTTNGPTNTAWSCTTTAPQATAAAADNLTVVASE